MPTIELWSAHHDLRQPFESREPRKLRISGLVYGHHRFDDGERILTGWLAGVNGRVVTTVGGTVYRLGDVSPDFVRWMHDASLPFDPEAPLRLSTPAGPLPLNRPPVGADNGGRRA